MREESRDKPRFSIFYCGCKQPKSIHMLLLRVQRYKLFPFCAIFPCFSLWVLKKSLSLHPCIVMYETFYLLNRHSNCDLEKVKEQ